MNKIQEYIAQNLPFILTDAWVGFNRIIMDRLIPEIWPGCFQKSRKKQYPSPWGFSVSWPEYNSKHLNPPVIQVET